MSEMLTVTLDMMGVAPDLVEKMSEMDPASMMNQMYYTAMGLLPIFILCRHSGKFPDRGSGGPGLHGIMCCLRPQNVPPWPSHRWYSCLWVPLLIIGVVGATRIGTSFLFYDEVNVAGMVALVIRDVHPGGGGLRSVLYGKLSVLAKQKSMAFGGGLAVWFSSRP